MITTLYVLGFIGLWWAIVFIPGILFVKARDKLVTSGMLYRVAVGSLLGPLWIFVLALALVVFLVESWHDARHWHKRIW